MTATLSAQAESKKTGRPSNPKVDNPAPVTARLRRLAIVHQRAAISRAMRLAGIHGPDKPTLDELDRAENPPAPRWRPLSHPAPTEADIRAAAAAVVRNPAWLMARDKLSSHEDQVRAAMPDAGRALFAAWDARPDREMANKEKWTAGQRHAERWRPVLDALDGILTHAEEMIPDLALAAMPEDDLKNMARDEAEAWRAVLISELRLRPRPYTPEDRRAMCPQAQMRKLRRRAADARQHAAALFGTVGGKGALYADSYTMQRWKERQANAAVFAAAMVLVTASGKTVPMSEIMANSQKAALARLYSMTKGMDGVAVRQGWAAVFVSVTLPPEFHPNPSKGNNSYDPRLSPKHADTELKDRLKRLRSRMNKACIPSFGTRIAEPHKDGCPHGHLVLYMPQADIPRLKAMLKDLWPDPSDGQEDEEEKRIATKCVTIDRARAAPTTYLFKYLVKSMNAPPGTGTAQADGKDREDGDHLANHERHRAWASERGIRRWAMWGTHGMQRVWQCLHQRKEMPADAPKAAQDAWKAIKEGRYGDALDASGAVKHAATQPRIPAATVAVQAAAAWAASDTATAFSAALAEHGIQLAHHDKTGRGRLVDKSGKAWALDWLLRDYAKAGGPPAPTRAERAAKMAGFDAPTISEVRARPRLKLAYEEVETRYGDTRRRPCGITLSGTDWTMPLKQGESRVMTHADHQAEQKARDEEAEFEARRQAMADWRAAHARGETPPHPGMVTVVVSYPRSRANGGVDGGGTGRTGPPDGTGQDGMPETTSCHC